MSRLVVFVASAALIMACHRRESEGADASSRDAQVGATTPLVVPPIEPLPVAREEFERLPAVYAFGTKKLCSRVAFLVVDSPEVHQRAFDRAAFNRQAEAVFGRPNENHEWVLRHRPSGLVIVLYAGESGPSFGGGPIYDGALPPPDEKELLARTLATPSRAPANDPRVDALSSFDLSRWLCQTAQPVRLAPLAAGVERLLARVDDGR